MSYLYIKVGDSYTYYNFSSPGFNRCLAIRT